MNAPTAPTTPFRIVYQVYQVEKGAVHVVALDRRQNNIGQRSASGDSGVPDALGVRQTVHYYLRHTFRLVARAALTMNTYLNESPKKIDQFLVL